MTGRARWAVVVRQELYPPTALFSSSGTPTYPSRWLSALYIGICSPRICAPGCPRRLPETAARDLIDGPSHAARREREPRITNAPHPVHRLDTQDCDHGQSGQRSIRRWSAAGVRLEIARQVLCSHLVLAPFLRGCFGGPRRLCRSLDPRQLCRFLGPAPYTGNNARSALQV